jgi:hypothetical protein
MLHASRLKGHGKGRLPSRLASLYVGPVESTREYGKPRHDKYDQNDLKGHRSTSILLIDTILQDLHLSALISIKLDRARRRAGGTLDSAAVGEIETGSRAPIRGTDVADLTGEERSTRCCDTQANDGMCEADLRSATSPRYGLTNSFARSTVAFGVA